MSEKSAVRSCGRDLVEFFKSTEWAFYVQVTPSFTTASSSFLLMQTELILRV